MIKRQNLAPVVFIFLVTCLIFFKIFLKGLYPIPADLLVSFYFPWYSGGWEGYNPWTTHKEMLGADSIRQIYLWKEFAAESFRSGQFPLWNPYTFSGQPLLANFQSSVYYPLNVFYFLTDPKNAWILLIVTQPFLGGIFMYMALRSFKISSVPSVFAAVAFMFSSYLVTWMENGNISHAYIWLPLAFWAINNFFENRELSGGFRYILILILSLSFSILAGHPQTAIYLYMVTFLFWVYKTWESKNQKLVLAARYFLVVATTIFVTAIQLIPVYQFYQNSPISLPFSKEVFEKSIMPYKNLVTFFASDFFGHPATGNFWSQTYGDFTPYFGVIPLVFAIWGIFRFWKNSFVKFATFVSVIFILSAVRGPITWFIKTFQIPLLDSTTPSRFISISIFLLIILSAFGFEDFIQNIHNKKYLKKFFTFLIPFLVIYGILWLFAIFGHFFLKPQDTWKINLSVTRRNLILPTLMFISIPLLGSMIQIIKLKTKLSAYWLKTLFVVSILTVIVVGGIYYTNKFLPVAPKKFIFPDHPLFYWLQHAAGIDRFYGGGTAHIDFNSPTHYKVYGAEGYDTLRLQRYAQLLASGFLGKVPESYLRSDGVFSNEENGYRRRLFELLGVKYLLDKEDNPKTGADWHYERFPGDNVRGFWQYDKFKVYMRQPTLPRVFQTTKYYVAKSDKEIIEKIYDQNFSLQTLILEKEPPIKISPVEEEIFEPQLVKYEPNEIKITTNYDYNSLLFISDAFDPDWQVYLDGKPWQLLRAHYALRSTPVPKGKHLIIFKYQPKSFNIGVYTSSLSFIGLLVFSVYLIIKRKF